MVLVLLGTGFLIALVLYMCVGGRIELSKIIPQMALVAVLVGGIIFWLTLLTEIMSMRSWFSTRRRAVLIGTRSWSS